LSDAPSPSGRTACLLTADSVSQPHVTPIRIRIIHTRYSAPSKPRNRDAPCGAPKGEKRGVLASCIHSPSWGPGRQWCFSCCALGVRSLRVLHGLVRLLLRASRPRRHLAIARARTPRATCTAAARRAFCLVLACPFAFALPLGAPAPCAALRSEGSSVESSRHATCALRPLDRHQEHLHDHHLVRARAMTVRPASMRMSGTSDHSSSSSYK
jgi:hypothetical protein